MTYSVEGLNDNESLPYLVSKAVGDRYLVYNFRFHGYGPHQMLAALEQGLVDDIIIQCTPRFTIYQSISAHVGRVAGYSSWDAHGPYYKIENGEAVYQRHFDDGKFSPDFLAKQLKKSYIYNQYILSQTGKLDDEMIALTVAVVRKSRHLFEQKYPGNKFHIILWDESGKLFPVETVYIYNKLKQEYETVGIPVHYIADMLPNYLDNVEPYTIHEQDLHPNAYAY
ncbi:MAG TPA: hypothetical protein ENI62_01625 [Gammaproteobacteria bacterium]|nr:hypothetical protein [Gammaproteobacteria bacterium]